MIDLDTNVSPSALAVAQRRFERARTADGINSLVLHGHNSMSTVGGIPNTNGMR